MTQVARPIFYIADLDLDLLHHDAFYFGIDRLRTTPAAAYLINLVRAVTRPIFLVLEAVVQLALAGVTLVGGPLRFTGWPCKHIGKAFSASIQILSSIFNIASAIFYGPGPRRFLALELPSAADAPIAISQESEERPTLHWRGATNRQQEKEAGIAATKQARAWGVEEKLLDDDELTAYDAGEMDKLWKLMVLRSICNQSLSVTDLDGDSKDKIETLLETLARLDDEGRKHYVSQLCHDLLSETEDSLLKLIASEAEALAHGRRSAYSEILQKALQNNDTSN